MPKEVAHSENLGSYDHGPIEVFGYDNGRMKLIWRGHERWFKDVHEAYREGRRIRTLIRPEGTYELEQANLEIEHVIEQMGYRVPYEPTPRWVVVALLGRGW